ncbi:MAG: GAF domain-containing protein [Phototrophicaceae bacterium]
MTQTQSSSAQAVRTTENPFLERVMRLLGIGLSIGVSIFAISGIWGNIVDRRNDIQIDYNNGLERITESLQQKLDSYTNSLMSLSNDPNLSNHLTGTPNIVLAAASAGELLQVNSEEYIAVQFIELRDGVPYLAFDRVNNNGAVTNVTAYDDVIYTPSDASAEAFNSILSNNIQGAITLGEFYLPPDVNVETANNRTVLLDAYIPVYANGNTPRMIISLTIDTNQLRNIVNFADENFIDETASAASRRVVWLVDTDTVIADSNAFGANYIANLNADGGNINGNDFYETIITQSGLLSGTEEPIYSLGNGTIYGASVVPYPDLSALGWRIIITDNFYVYYQPTVLVILGIIALAALIPIIILQSIKQILRPFFESVYEADTLVQTIARDSNAIVYSTGDQAELVTAARRIATRVNRLSEDLKKQTQLRNRDLQVAGRIGRQTATLTDLDTLANRSINLICNELGFYHAQIFLIDESQTFAELRYSRGDAGNKLIAEGHRLLVGSDSVIGTVSQEKRPVIVNDTATDKTAPHAANPILGDTRSEMGLPLLIGDNILGVLDIQSRTPQAFQQDDIATYQLLADQISVAIYNAQLQKQTEQRIEQIRTLNRQLTRDAWSELENTLDLDQSYGASIEQPKLSADINVRGQVLGHLEANLPDNQQFSDGDRQILQSVAERVSLAIENARLFQETQASLSETSVLYQLSRQLNEATDLEDVLEAIINTVATDASGGQVWLFDEAMLSSKPDWVRITVDLAIVPRETDISLIGKRLQLSQYPFMERLSAIEISTVDNIKVLSNIRNDLAQMFFDVNAQSMVFIPLNMRGSWKGFMSITFNEAHQFSERDVRIYDALIAQAGVAIDNRLLLQQTEDALARQEKLYAASRIINTSQSLSDLVFAAVATASDPRLDFWLGMLEGDADREGWGNLSHIVAQSHNGTVETVNTYHDLFVPQHSPMRQREPEILVDPGEDIEDVPPLVTWMRDLEYKFMAIFPLFSDNTPIALFYIVNKQSYDLSQDDYEVYRALTGQMSTQIQNRSLLTQTEDTLNEIRRLYVATRAISSAQDTRAIYDAVAGHLAMPIIQQNARIQRELNLSITVLLASPDPDIDAPNLRYEYSWNSNPTHSNKVLDGTLIAQEDAPFGQLIGANDDGLLIYKDINQIGEQYPKIRDILGAHEATSAVVAPLWSRARWFGVLILRTDQAQVLDEGYTRFMQSIADQVAIAVENQRLLQETQFERQRLDEILATLPVGVMVLDPATLMPISANERVPELLGQAVQFNQAFSAEAYNLYKTGTNYLYETHKLPMYIAGQQSADDIASIDDVVVVMDEFTTLNLFISAAPIFDADGIQQAIVVALQDITNLRSMESMMQESLRETVLLYETQSALTAADNLDDLLDALIAQLAIQQPTDAHIIMLEDKQLWLARSLVTPFSNVSVLEPILQNKLLTIDTVQRDMTLNDSVRKHLIALEAASVMIVPLNTRTRQHPLGWIMLLAGEPEAFTIEQERVMTSVADMSSQAIDNQYLVESSQKALAETEALYNANTAISRAVDRFGLFDAIEELLSTLNPDMSAAYLFTDDDTIEEMFRHGFDDSIANGLDLERLMTLPLPRSDGMYVADITRNTMSPFELEVVKAGTIMAFAAINIRVKGVTSGRLLLGYENAHNFSTSDERYLNTIADSAGVVIDNQLLLNQVQGTLQETSVLYQASKALIDASEPEEIIDVIVSYLIEPHITQVFIAMLNVPNWDDPVAAVDFVAGWHAEDDVDLLGVSLTKEQFPAWTVLATDNVLIINDIHENNDLDLMTKMNIESLEAQSLVVLPLKVTGRSIGAIWLGSPETHAYTDRDLRVYQAFAEQTSLALEAKRLVEQTEQRARQLQTSAVISQNVGQILDLDVLLPQVVDLIQDQFYYDHVQIFLMDDDNEWALLRASTGEAGKNLLNVGHKLKRGSASVIGSVTEIGQPSIALDTADAAVVHQPNPFLPLTRSEMALPMVVKGEIVGALDVQSNDPNAFTDEDVQVLTILASQIAVAIDNARLYEDAERSAKDMSFLFEMTSKAASAETLNDALEYVANEIRSNTRADLVAIYLPQMYEDYHGNRKQIIEIGTIATDNAILVNHVESVEVGDAESLIGIVSHQVKPQIIPNTRHEHRYQALTTTCQSAIVLPIQSGTTMVGVLVLESHRLNAYTQDTITLLQTLAGSLGAVVQNTLLVEQLQESVEQLREVDRLKSQFLASMSHELRTPLNSIIGFSRVMLKGIDGPLSEMQEQDLTTIYNSGNHLLRLINDILDQAKIEANELNLRFAYFEMKPLVESVKSIAIGLMKEKANLRLLVEVADGLPKVYGDEIRSRQILLNLVTNAIKFTESGTVTVDVYAVEGDPEPMIRVDVIDTGMGIAPADLPTVFEQFRQVDNSLTRTVGGTGLGLPISKSLSELQGGELTVVSEVGVGSTFSVTIPTYEGAGEALEKQLNERRSAQKPVSSSSPLTTTSSGLISRKDIEEARKRAEMGAVEDSNGSSKTDTQEIKVKNTRIDTNVTQNIPIVTQKRDVILVEDDKTMVDQFRRILQREGFEVSTADFPAFAEAMIGQLRPNVVILDVNFANGVGWDLLKNLKERDDTFDIPVVVTTIDTDSERAYRLGAHTFIERPFLGEDVLDAVLKAEKESQRERIVIIDDQPDAIRLLTQMLEEHSDFKVYSAQSGDEGISLIARRRPDLIILDLRMPGKDGFAVLDELRGNPETAKIPVLVVTGELDLSNAEQEQLIDIHVLQKTDISQEEYALFIDNIRSFLEANNRK